MLIARVHRYLMREILVAWFAVTLVLVVVLLTNRLVRFMASAAQGDVPAHLIFTLLGLKAVAHLGTVLPASFFLAVILALGRLHRDSEMAVMSACGVGARDLLRSLYALAIPLALLVAGCGLVLGPRAEAIAQTLTAQARAEAQFQGLQGGRFISLDNGGTLYVGAVADDGTLRGVFARFPSSSNERLVVADRAYRRTEADTGARFLVLVSGARYDGIPGEGRWRILRFAEYGIRLDAHAPASGQLARDGRSVGTLLDGPSRADFAELQWRLAMPISVLLLALAAVPLGRAVPRQGRYAKLIVAVLIYIAYFNGLKAAQQWYENGQIPAWLGLWWVHAALGLLATTLWWRQYGVRRRRRS